MGSVADSWTLYASVFIFVWPLGLCRAQDPYLIGLDPIVTTGSGRVRGAILYSRLQTPIYSFTGIPYAKPPIGNLRFAEAVKVDNWLDVLSATKPSPNCVQFSLIIPNMDKTIGQEDCLYVDVYTPNLDSSTSNPVMCYFHGGAWYSGGIQEYNPEYLVTQNLVLVEVNYRLGALGFLSLEDDQLPGNLGLKDQNFALKWIKENIRNFGGDPNQVTIFGEDVGGSSAHLHMFSPLSRNLFHRSISISGTAMSPFAVLPAGLAKARALNLSQTLRCPKQDSNKIITCLRGKPAYEIVDAQKMFFVWEMDPLVVLGPVVDKQSRNPFLPVEPIKTNSIPVPWMIGISSGEGLIRSSRFTLKPEGYNVFNKDFDKLAPIMLMYNGTVNDTDVVNQKIRDFYFGKEAEITEKSFKNLTDMYTDALFLYPAIESLKRHPGNAFLYYFDYLGKSSFVDKIASKRMLNYATHTDDLIYLFNMTIMPPLQGNDESVSATLVNYITNFVLVGVPLPKKPTVKFSWDPWKQRLSCLNLTKDGSFISKNLLSDRYKFWSELFKTDQ